MPVIRRLISGFLICQMSTIAFAQTTSPQAVAVGVSGKPTVSNTRDAPQSSRPNIVIILADDLGYGDIEPYGQSKAQTPYLNELAKEGLKFTQHYAGSTVCAPSRAAMLTGRDTGTGLIRGNKDFGDSTDEGELGQLPLAAGTSTLATMLKGVGYETAMIGKWGLGGAGTTGDPNNQGFDYAFGALDQMQAHNYYPTHLWENGTRFPLRNSFFSPHVPRNAPSKAEDIYTKWQGLDYAPDRLIGKAEDFIEDNAGKRPFFLFYTPALPHAALQIPYPLVARYDGRFLETPLDRTAYTPTPTPRAARAAMITRLDEEVGRIRSALARAGQADNTIIIFTSDNGPSPEGGADVEFFDASGGLRGQKRDLYEGGIRVPFIIYWPGKTPTGATSTIISASWDIMPTLAAITGASAPKAIDGHSFMPALLGQEQKQTGPLYWEYHEPSGQGPVQAVRDGKWKAVRFQSGGFDRKRPVELYDLDRDPAEQHDVARDNRAVVARMKRILDSRLPSPIAGFNFEARRP